MSDLKSALEQFRREMTPLYLHPKDDSPEARERIKHTAVFNPDPEGDATRARKLWLSGITEITIHGVVCTISDKSERDMTSSFDVVLKEGRESTTVTIAADRTSLKIPSHHPPDLREQITAFLKRIEGDVRARSHGTMRGGFNKEFTKLTLTNNSRTTSLSYDFERKDT